MNKVFNCHCERHGVPVAIWEGESLHPDCFVSACGGWSRNDRLNC